MSGEFGSLAQAVRQAAQDETRKVNPPPTRALVVTVTPLVLTAIDEDDLVLTEGEDDFVISQQLLDVRNRSSLLVNDLVIVVRVGDEWHALTAITDAPPAPFPGAALNGDHAPLHAVGGRDYVSPTSIGAATPAQLSSSVAALEAADAALTAADTALTAADAALGVRLDSVEPRTPTTAEKAALPGTSGSAVSGTNKLVDNADARIPTQAENDALVGTSGAAVSATNKLVDNADTRLGDSPFHNVKSYGTTGTADDSTVFQAALNAAAVAGGDVWVPPGTYIATGLQMKSRVALRGSRGAKLVHKAGATTHLITFDTAVSDALLDGVEIDGNRLNQTTGAHAVVVRGTRNRVTGCYVYDAKIDAINIGDAAEHISIDHNRVRAPGRYGIVITGPGVTPAQHIGVRNNHVKDSGRDYIGTGNGCSLGIVSIGEHVVFANNVTEGGSGDGVAAYNESNQHVLVIGNVFNDPGNHGVHLGGSYLSIVGNECFSPAAHGYFLSSGSGGGSDRFGFVVADNIVQSPALIGISVRRHSRGTVSGNTVGGPGDRGMEITDAVHLAVTGNTIRSAASHNMVLSGVAASTITGNVSTDSLGAGLLVQDGFVVAAVYDLVVSGNTVRANAGTGIKSTGASDRLCMTGNVVRANTVAQISLVGANNVNANNITA
jgi:hypothetical protein